MSTRSVIRSSMKGSRYPKKRKTTGPLGVIQFFVWLAIMLAVFAH